MNPKTPPKRKKSREAITYKGNYLNFIEREFKAMERCTATKPNMEIHENSQNGLPTSIKLTAANPEKDFAFAVSFAEIILPDRNEFKVKKFRFEFKPIYTPNDFFRFDFAPFSIPDKYPECHINVDKHLYGHGKRHLVYPQDTLLDLHKLTAEKAELIFEQYERTNVHPTKDFGKSYLGIVNRQEDYL